MTYWIYHSSEVVQSQKTASIFIIKMSGCLKFLSSQTSFPPGRERSGHRSVSPWNRRLKGGVIWRLPGASLGRADLVHFTLWTVHGIYKLRPLYSQRNKSMLCTLEMSFCILQCRRCYSYLVHVMKV